MKKILLSLFLVFSYQLSTAQCGLRQISLNDRATASDLIVEGKVISRNSFWNAEHNMIYTSNTIEVYKVFKGSLATTSIEILTVGGTVGLDRIVAEPSLTLNIGDIGVFTCETVKRFNVPNNKRSSLPQYEAYASSQGFVKYNLANQTASDPFQIYNDIETELYKVVLSPSAKSWTTVIPFDIHNNEATQKLGQTPTINSITGFSPTTVTAGTGTTITITGSGFGSTQGSGTVGFKNADDGGATYINPLATQYISWSSTQIVVEVPSNAGTGTIQVTQGTTQTSTSTLTVSYAHLNVDFDPGSGTEAYETDHIDDNSSGGYTWRMNTGFDSDASAKASFTRAFDEWRCNTGVNWTIGSTTSINDAVSDGTNVICFDNTAPLSSGILGVCYSYWSGCASGATIVWYVSELDIIFDEGSNITPLTWEYGTSTPTSSEYDFETVALHELGHGHQLGHVINSGAVMHYSISNGTSNRVLGTNDLAGGNYVQAKSIVANICGPGAMTNYVCATAPVAAFTGSPTTLCAGSSVTFTDQSTNTPTSWSWTFTGGTPSSSTSQNPTVTYSTAGTYAVSLTATNSAGSDVETKTGYITVNAAPTATTSQTNVSCNGGSTGSATVTASGGGGSYSYSWSPSGGSASTASSLAAGTYSCTVTDVNGCTVVKSITITQPTALTVSASSTSPICNGSSVNLTASASGGTGSVSYVWMPGSLSGSSVSASPTSTTTYTVTGTDANGCTDNATAAVTVNSLPTVSASSTSPICNGSSVNLTASGATTYTWMPGSLSGSSVSASPTTSTTYTVTGTNSSGCSNTATAAVTVNSLPGVSASASPTSITSGSSSSLTGSGASTYSWMPGSLSGSSVSVSPTSTTTYTVTGTSSQGCSNTANVTVTVTASSGVTKLQTAYCGITETSLSQTLYCDAVSGATQYRYEVTAPDNSVYVYTRTNSLTNFQMNWISSVGYAQTYSVKVAALVSGVWSSYGTACNVTTPAEPTTQLSAAYCGITETSLSQTLYCNSIVGATNYRYEITDVSTSAVTYYTRGNSLTNFSMSWVSSVAYNKTYSIRVAAYVGGTWLPYGTACSVTTPPEQTTQLNTASCGITETSLSQTLYCNSVTGATNYKYEITDVSTSAVTYYTRGNSLTNFSMSWVSSVAYNKTYSIRVAAYVGGTWVAYGTACNVTTPAEPTTELSAAYCGITETSLSQILYCNSVTGATNYRYEITDVSTSAVTYYTRGNSLTSFAMSWVSSVGYNKTYSIKVAAYVGGTWLPYGTACNVTTPASAIAPIENLSEYAKIGDNSIEENVAEQLEVTAFPNPTSGILNIESTGKINTIWVYSFSGTLVSKTENASAVDLNEVETGVYFVIVQTEKGTKHLRIIKQ